LCGRVQPPHADAERRIVLRDAVRLASPPPPPPQTDTGTDQGTGSPQPDDDPDY
ncbi:hypothetical protein PIB30_100923, partial [Stylosanthes scabra]|nr:hypothetical protein [Stylosanthes scabra]